MHTGASPTHAKHTFYHHQRAHRIIVFFWFAFQFLAHTRTITPRMCRPAHWHYYLSIQYAAAAAALPSSGSGIEYIPHRTIARPTPPIHSANITRGREHTNTHTNKRRQKKNGIFVPGQRNVESDSVPRSDLQHKIHTRFGSVVHKRQSAEGPKRVGCVCVCVFVCCAQQCRHTHTFWLTLCTYTPTLPVSGRVNPGILSSHRRRNMYYMLGTPTPKHPERVAATAAAASERSYAP